MKALRIFGYTIALLLALYLPANATAYQLCNSTTTTAAPTTAFIPPGTAVANLSAGGALSSVQVPANQTFQIVVTTTTGNGSATVQPFVSNDGSHWIAYGSALVVASAASPAQISGTGTAAWAYYTMQVTAISGTGAVVTCTMNA